MNTRLVMANLLRHLPQSWLNNFLLTFPHLYQTRFVTYESHMFDAIDRLNEIVLKDTRDVTGDIIECGASRCGTSCLIGTLLKRYNIPKRVFALDSFGKGFDKAELQNERLRGSTTAKPNYFKYNSIQYVTRKIQSLRLEAYVIPIEGWFRETLRTIKGPFSFAIIDCDLERSTEECLDYVWPRLSKNGLALIDDYKSSEYKGTRAAVDRFLERREEEVSHFRAANRFEISK